MRRLLPVITTIIAGIRHSILLIGAIRLMSLQPSKVAAGIRHSILLIGAIRLRFLLPRKVTCLVVSIINIHMHIH